MNLHEECLIKYLTNPLDLFRSTELLKINNLLIKEELLKNRGKKVILTNSDLAYNG